jgi:uncharacterized protein
MQTHTATAPRAARPRRKAPAKQMAEHVSVPFKVSDSVLANAHVNRRNRRKTAAVADPFKPYAPSKEVTGGMAMDTCDGTFAGLTWARASGNSIYAEGQTFMGYPELALMAQRPEYRIISETMASEMTRKWIEFTVAGEDGTKHEKIARIKDEFDRLGVRDVFRRVAEQDGLFGRGHIYLDTGDTDDNDELGTPLGNGRNATSRAKISPARPLKRLKSVEAVWCYPSAYNSSNPLKPDWYKPTTWYVMGQQIHSSRLLTFIGREVPDLLKPAYAFGGLSLSQLVKPYVDNWLVTRQSVQDIIHSFSVFILKTNMSGVLSGAGGDDFFKRLDVFNAGRDNTGLMAIDKETEEFANVSAPLSGLDHLQAQSQEHVCSASRLPLVKYTGISPSGLNASSDGELRCFEDLIHGWQELLFRPGLRRILGFVQLSLYGEIDPSIGFEFLPITEMTEKEKAELRKVEADTGAVLVETGVISQQEERQRVANDPDTPYAGLDIEDMPDLAAEEEEGLMPRGMSRGEAEPGAGGAAVGKDEFPGAMDREFKRGGDPENSGRFSSTGGAGGKKAKPAAEKKPAVKKPAAEKATKVGAAPKPQKAAKSAKPSKVSADLMAKLQTALSAHPDVMGELMAALGVSEAKAPAKPAKGRVRPAGSAQKIVTPDGKMEVEAEPQIVELADLIHAKGDLQPRNRNTAESRVTARERAAKLDPEQLKPGRVSDAGAPIIDDDGTIISGNGRVLSLREVYNDAALKSKSAEYRKALGAAAKGMKQPVMVMRLPAGMSHEQRVEFADRSNRSRIESMSATDRARRDAKAAGLGTMALYKGGDFTSPANREFMHAFTQKVMNANERAQFSKEGRLTKEGADRLSSAVLASAYDDVDALSLMLESTDDNVRAITNSMRDTAGKFAELKAGIADGRMFPEMDITRNVSDAAKLVSHLRKSGTSIAAHFAQIDAFSQPDPMVEALVKSFYNEGMTRALSQQKITAILDAYAEEAAKHEPGGFLPDETRAPDVLKTAKRKAKPDAEGSRAGLFGDARPEPGNGASGQKNRR